MTGDGGGDLASSDLAVGGTTGDTRIWPLALNRSWTYEFDTKTSAACDYSATTDTVISTSSDAT